MHVAWLENAACSAHPEHAAEHLHRLWSSCLEASQLGVALRQLGWMAIYVGLSNCLPTHAACRSCTLLSPLSEGKSPLTFDVVLRFLQSSSTTSSPALTGLWSGMACRRSTRSATRSLYVLHLLSYWLLVVCCVLYWGSADGARWVLRPSPCVRHALQRLNRNHQACCFLSSACRWHPASWHLTLKASRLWTRPMTRQRAQLA